MKKIKIRELSNWPPEPGGIIRGNSPSSSEQAKVTRVQPKLVDGLVTFVGEFEGHEHTYDYAASSEELAEAIRETLRKHLETSVFGLGDLEVELETGDRSAA
jgi:hypothetical protein